MVLVDGSGQAIGDGYAWSDQAGVAQLGSLWLPGKQELARAGRPCVVGSAVARLHAMSVNSQMPDGVQWVLSPKDFVLLRLTGVAVTDATSAAYTLAFDVRERRWSPELISPTGLDVAQFPPVFAGDAVVGSVVASAATGLPAGVDVVTGGPDGTVGTAAIAGTADDVVVDIAGTTDVLTRVTRLLFEPPAGALLNPYVTADAWSYGGPTGMTGGAVAYVSRLLGLGDVEDAMAAGAQQWNEAGVGSAGLLVAPSFTGERFPRWRHDRAGGVFGLRDYHSPMHVLRATQEAAAFVVSEGVDLLAGPRDSAVSVVLAGGTSRSRLLAQLRADVLGRQVQVCREPDVTLLGAVALASVGADVHASLDDAVAGFGLPMDRLDPDPASESRYGDVYAEWLTRAMT